jgi:cyclophilin family peptidyl-prolyl cis-trans isomerase/HEAT repeat protein
MRTEAWPPRIVTGVWAMRAALSITLALFAAACAPHAPTTASPSAPPSSAEDRRAGSRATADVAWSEPDIALYADLLAAADARHADTTVVRRGLASSREAVRIEAARSAGQNHVWGARSMLRVALTDRDTAVAATAAYALGLFPDTLSVSALRAALHGPPAVAREAAWSLGEIGEPARPALEGALREPRGSMPAIADVLLAAAKLRPVPVLLIVPYLTTGGLAGEPSVTAAAAEALSRSPSPAGVRGLLAVARGSDPDVRVVAARGLGSRAAGDSLGPQARDTVLALVADTDARVRAVAVRVVASYGRPARAAVLAALHDPDANVRVAASQVLDRVLGPGREAWSAAFDADTTLAYRRGVIAAAVRAGVILEAIDHDNADRWQRQGDWRYRAAVADAAVGTPIDRIVDLALPLTRDPDARVRAAAYDVFGSWLDSADASHHPWRRTYVQHALRDEDCVVRATALAALDQGATAADAPGALDAYTRAQHDSQSDARVAALRLLSDAWAHDSVHFPDSVRAAIRQLPPPTASLELAQAGPGSLWASWRAAQERGAAPHDRVWYDSIVRAVVLPTLAGRPLVARITTVRGTLTISLLGSDAPLTVANFAALARAGFYQGTAFHRVVPAFVVQDGDPRGDGGGGPQLTIRDEFNRRRYVRGTVGMALSGPDTGGSQYFLTLTPQPHLDGHYTVFGVLREGFDVLDHITQGDSISSVEIQ